MSEQPSTWPTTTIKKSSYLRGRIGWQGLRASEFLDHGPFLITGTDFLDSGRIDWSRCHHVSEERFREGAYIHVRDGDLLITKDGTIGKIAYVRDCPEKAVLNSGVFLLRCSDGSYKHRFLYQLLRSELFETFLRVNLAGSTISHLYQYVFERFEFPVPKVAVQQRIAEILSTVDEAIEQTEALIAKTQQIKAGLMHDLFTRGVTMDGHIRPYREEAPQLYQESPLGWIPKEWVADCLDGVTVRLTDGSHQSVRREIGTAAEVPFLFVSCVGEGRVNWERAAWISLETYSEISRGKEPHEGMVLFTVVGSIGRVGLMVSDMAAAFERNIACISPGPRVRPQFLARWLQTAHVQRHAKRIAVGNAQKLVSLSKLRQFPVVVPEPKEQQIICDRLASIDGTLDVYAEELAKLRNIRAGLMQDLLTGRVSATPETRSVLSAEVAARV